MNIDPDTVVIRIGDRVFIDVDSLMESLLSDLAANVDAEDFFGAAAGLNLVITGLEDIKNAHS